MDKREEESSATRYQQDLQKMRESGAEIDDSKNFVDENGKRFRVPYHMIKKVEFSNISKADMVSQEHAARLQYRLMLLDSVIKAYVEFQRQKITVIYNPDTADNIREKMSLEQLIEFLKGQGINVDRNAMAERDYDYYKEFYNYAFNPKVIREHPPYGYTLEQWKKMKPEWEKAMKEGEEKKQQHFKEYQQSYEKLHPEVYGSKEPPVAKAEEPQKKPSFMKRLSKMFSKESAQG